MSSAMQFASKRRCDPSVRATIGSTSKRAKCRSSARHVIVTVPPALVLDIDFDPVLPADRRALYTDATAGPETKTVLVYDEAFWRSDGFSGQTSEPESAAEVTIDASAPTGRPGVIASFTFGRVARRFASLDANERRQFVLDALTARLGPKAAVTVRSHRDRVVGRSMDARLLDGPSLAGNADTLRAPSARTVRSGALGGHRDVGDIARRHRRRGPVG